MTVTLTNSGLPMGEAQGTAIKDNFFIRMNNMLTRVYTREISWIHADGNYCYINTNLKKYAVKLSMKKLIARLAPGEFIRIHKSYIVRMDSIEGIDIHQNLVLLENRSLPIGRVFKHKLLEQLDVW